MSPRENYHFLLLFSLTRGLQHLLPELQESVMPEPTVSMETVLKKSVTALSFSHFSFIRLPFFIQSCVCLSLVSVSQSSILHPGSLTISLPLDHPVL